MGKVVLITGSSSGIGAQTAVEFARLGAQVVVTGRDAQRVSDVAKQCREVSPKGIKPLEVLADMSVSEDCRRLIATTIDTFTRLDVLVNNAGKGVLSTITDPDIMHKYGDCMDTNLRSVVLLTHLCAQHLTKTGGNIVNISSNAAIKPAPRLPLYRTAKCTIDMFTKCAALELAPYGVRVNSICAGAVMTNFLLTMGSTKQESGVKYNEIAMKTPVGRVGEPIDIANAVLYLSSPDAQFIAGSCFVCDGGYVHI
ncbi:unnamed protein product [Oppiella nova]|uniref:Uncharacterized protein n=1 Tax=Oppiella nova TaxID=334625 RepID=A0A7R9LQF9_9ACAR|nr:unnamed protein product [Oppiella nova]CAG2165948.1 unnamed protein product [Oppiella nova]